MTNGIDLDGAGIDMWPAETSALVDELAKAGTDFRSAWLAKLGEIASLDSQLGQGPLGREFARQYIPGVKQIVDALDELGRRVEDRVSFGRTAVREYVAADQRNAQKMRPQN